MAEKQMPNFLYLLSKDKAPELMLNLDQVRMVIVEDNQLRLLFSETHTVSITGDAYAEVLGLLANTCIVTDGTPLPDHIARLKPRKDGQEP